MNKQKPNLTISDKEEYTLNTLIDANFLNLSNAATAQLLQQRGISTVTGKEYTRQSVENMLFKFRYPGNSHSKMFKALMTAIAAGLISLNDAVRMLEHATAEWRRPQLCHICFTGADKETYLAIVKRLCRELKAEGVECDYKAAIEDDKGGKGLHYHLMLVIDHKDNGPNPFRLISYSPKSLLRRAVDHFKDVSSVQYRINPSTYSGSLFLPISKTNYEIFNEAVEWISYIYKTRSKNLVEGTIYYSSRDRQPKKPRTLH